MATGRRRRVNMSHEQKLARSGCTQVSELRLRHQQHSGRERGRRVWHRPAAASAPALCGNWVATFPKRAPPRPASASMTGMGSGPTTSRSRPGNRRACGVRGRAWSPIASRDRRPQGEDGWPTRDAENQGPIAADRDTRVTARGARLLLLISSCLRARRPGEAALRPLPCFGIVKHRRHRLAGRDR